MRLAIPGPNDLLKLAERGRDTLEDLAALVPRLLGVVGEVESLIARVSTVVTAIDKLEKRAGDAVGDVERIVGQVEPLLGRLDPTLDKLEPIVTRIADTTDPDEVEALVRLVNYLPELVDKIDTDVLPMLDTLGTVAPDLRELLVTSQELNEIVAAIPGLGRMRKRVEDQRKAADARWDREHLGSRG